MSEVYRDGSRLHDNEGHAVSSWLSPQQIRTLMDEADGGWSEFYRHILAHKKREAAGGECGSPCTCLEFEKAEAER